MPPCLYGLSPRRTPGPRAPSGRTRRHSLQTRTGWAGGAAPPAGDTRPPHRVHAAAPPRAVLPRSDGAERDPLARRCHRHQHIGLTPTLQLGTGKVCPSHRWKHPSGCAVYSISSSCGPADGVGCGIWLSYVSAQLVLLGYTNLGVAAITCPISSRICASRPLSSRSGAKAGRSCRQREACLASGLPAQRMGGGGARCQARQDNYPLAGRAAQRHDLFVRVWIFPCPQPVDPRCKVGAVHARLAGSPTNYPGCSCTGATECGLRCATASKQFSPQRR